MRCLASSIILSAFAGAEEFFPQESEDAGLQLLQLKTTKIEHAEGELRPKTTSTEAESMQNAECDLWGDVHIVKTFYGFAAGWLGDAGLLFIKHKDGSQSQIGDAFQTGLYTMANSRDGRFKSQIFQTAPGQLVAAAFEVNGNTIAVTPPTPMPLEDIGDNERLWVLPDLSNDPDTFERTWMNHKLGIRINGKLYSQSDLPITIPDTGIEVQKHQWPVRKGSTFMLKSGLVVVADGFRGQVECQASRSNLWMNVNVKFTPDNIPDRDEDSFCGIGPKAKPFGGDGAGADGDGDWDASIFSPEDHEAICSFANRFNGKSGTKDNFMELAAAKHVCSKPELEPEKLTAKDQCIKIECDIARGEQLCLPIKETGALYEDCLFDFCQECDDGAADNFVEEVDMNFPEEEGDTASAEADPHLTTNTNLKYDLKP